MAIEFSCPYCGKATQVAPKYAGQTGPCGQCGQTITIPCSDGAPLPASDKSALGDDGAIRMVLPVGRSPWAIIAGYAGLLSIIPIFAPVAVISGIVALVDIKNHPNKHGMGRAVFGLAAGLICSVLWLIAIVDGVFR